jgi:hypothetical protein
VSTTDSERDVKRGYSLQLSPVGALRWGRRHHNLPFRMAFELARLGFDAWMVASLRTLRLGAGGQAAVLEAQRMIAEKSAAMLEAQAAAGMALATGSSSRAAARKLIAPYRRRVRSNRRRLMRASSSSPGRGAATHSARRRGRL